MGMTVGSLHVRRFTLHPSRTRWLGAADVRGVERVPFISGGSVQEKNDKLDLGLCQMIFSCQFHDFSKIKVVSQQCDASFQRDGAVVSSCRNQLQLISWMMPSIHSMKCT